MSAKPKVRASCDCGKLSISVTSKPFLQLVCHCTDCREATGDPFTEVAFLAPGGYQVHGLSRAESMLGGTGLGKVYHACDACGSPLYATVNALGGSAGIIARRLAPFRFRPMLHVWTSEKLPETRLPWLASNLPKRRQMSRVR